MRAINRLHLGAALLHLSVAIALVVWYVQITTSSITFQIFDVVGDAELKVWHLGIKSLVYLLICFSTVTFVAHVIQACCEQNLLDGSNLVRWVEYTVTASIMLFVIAISSGVKCLDTLILLVVCCAMCMLCGYISEKYRDSAWLVTALGWVLMIACWGVILRNYIRETIDANVPTFVHAIVSTMLVLYISFGVIHFIHVIKGNNDAKVNYSIEIAYVIDSFVSKLTLVALLAGGLYARSTQTDVE